MGVAAAKPVLMVVDDEADFAEYVADVAGELGFEVKVHSSARDCLVAISVKRPDIIVMDIVMPDMDGVELVQEIGRRLPGAAVIVMSGFDSRYLGVVRTLGEAGGVNVCGSLMKPFAADELVAALTPFRPRRSEGDGK